MKVAHAHQVVAGLINLPSQPDHTGYPTLVQHEHNARVLRVCYGKSSCIKTEHHATSKRARELRAAMDDSRPTMTTAEAAAYLGCAESSLKSGRSRRRGPTYYRGIGRGILYRRADLDAFIEACRVAPEYELIDKTDRT
jgi:hypothetical protein